MKFWEFRQIQPKQSSNVYVFVCEDDFLIGESRVVWQRISGMPAGEWVSKKYSAKEFEEIPSSRLIDDALTRSLFTENRLIIVTDAARLTKARIEVLGRVQSLPEASLRIVLVTDTRKPVESWPKIFPVIEIDSLRPADVARWLMDRPKSLGISPITLVPTFINCTMRLKNCKRIRAMRGRSKCATSMY